MVLAGISLPFLYTRTPKGGERKKVQTITCKFMVIIATQIFLTDAHRASF